MTLKYEILKRLVKAANIKKMWTGMSTEELLENRRRQNAKNRIPALSDEAFDISRIEVMGFQVLKLIHKKYTYWEFSLSDPQLLAAILQWLIETGITMEKDVLNEN